MEHIGEWSVNNFTLEARKSTTKNTNMFAREHPATQDEALGLAVRLTRSNSDLTMLEDR